MHHLPLRYEVLDVDVVEVAKRLWGMPPDGAHLAQEVSQRGLLVPGRQLLQAG